MDVTAKSKNTDQEIATRLTIAQINFFHLQLYLGIQVGH